MTDVEPEQEALVLVGYAAMMEAIQGFEQTLRRLAVLRRDLPDGIDFDTAWKRTEKLLRQSMGRLEHLIPDGFKEQFAELRMARNWAAHETLRLTERRRQSRPPADRRRKLTERQARDEVERWLERQTAA